MSRHEQKAASYQLSEIQFCEARAKDYVVSMRPLIAEIINKRSSLVEFVTMSMLLVGINNKMISIVGTIPDGQVSAHMDQ